jgi:hypothetical protein
MNSKVDIIKNLKMSTGFHIENTNSKGLRFQIISPGVSNKAPVPENNWAFIDMQNLYKGVQERGWNIRWEYFRQYLGDRFNVTRAIAFLGYLKEYQSVYNHLRKAGFILEFRQVKRLSNGTIDGGNVDADLASYVMDYKNEYHKAIIIADDADYCRTIKSLNRQNKLRQVISSHLISNTSELIKRVVCDDQILSIHSLKNQIGYSKAV